MTPNIVSPDTLAKGQFVTIHRWLSHTDNSWKGAILEVRAVQLPFVVLVEHYRMSSPYSHRFQLDTRAVELMALDPGFVAEALGKDETKAADSVHVESLPNSEDHP